MRRCKSRQTPYVVEVWVGIGTSWWGILLRRGKACSPRELSNPLSVSGISPPLHIVEWGEIMFPFSPPPWPLPPTHPTPAHSTHTRTRTSPTRCDTAPLDKGWKEIVPSHRRVQREESEIIIDTGRHYPVRFYLALLPTTQLVRDLVGIHVGPLLPVDLGRGKRQGVLVRNRIKRADMDTDTAARERVLPEVRKRGGHGVGQPRWPRDLLPRICAELPTRTPCTR